MAHRLVSLLCRASVPAAALMLLVAGGARTASADLVVNGGFEAPVIPNGSYQLFPSIPGWSLGSYGTSIELQNHVAGSPFEGNQFLELDSDAISEVFQDLATVKDEAYTLSFAFSARPHVLDNSFTVSWDGSVIASLNADGTSLGDTDWHVFTYTVTASSNLTTLKFSGTNPSDSLGSYIDAVSVQAVPEPASLAMMGIGIASISGFARRRRVAKASA